MKITFHHSIPGILWALGVCGLAQAGACYEILDATNQVVYQSPVPPTSMGGGGAKDFHDLLRKRGHHLRWYESYSCPDKSAISPYGGKRTEAPGKPDPNIYLRITPPFGASAVAQGNR
jgi:hypothetical protein